MCLLNKIKTIAAAGIGLIAGFYSSAQVPHTPAAGEILQEIKKLKVLGSVLYIAAHPDDENTRLIAWLSNHALYRTGYLSLTRGDGGQNLIGDEQGVELGLIRTQELLAARRIDGGEQFFSRAFDFGFSKNPEETFRIWDKEAVLSDVVWVIRQFRPDVIIARFPEDGRAGHGHHSASGIMARLGYEAAGDADRFTEQFGKGARVWQPKRVLWNTFNFGSANTIDSTKQFSLEVGQYNTLTGKSIGELAGESRSQHKSQGFGVSRQRGNSKEYFSLVAGEPVRSSLMDGVTTSWDRVKNAEGVEAMINGIIRLYDMEHPDASIPALLELKSRLLAIQPFDHWVKIKLRDLDRIIQHCAGIYAEAIVTRPEVVNGDSVKLMLNIINRSDFPMSISRIGFRDNFQHIKKTLQPNVWTQIPYVVYMGNSVMETQPYWLRLPKKDGMFDVNVQQLIGKAENDPPTLNVSLDLGNRIINVHPVIQYRVVDPVKAELYNPIHVTNPFLIYNDPGVLLFRKNSSDSATLQVNIQSIKEANATSPNILLNGTSSGYKQQIHQSAMQFAANDKKTITLKVPNYMKGTSKEVDVLQVSFKPGGSFGDAEFFNARRMIEYDHIPTQTWHYQDVVKVLHIDLKTIGKKIGYLPGAGDKIPEALMQMGYQVTELKEADLKPEFLKQFDAVVMGVRAYNIHEYLAQAYDGLMTYVKNGGNLIVQYNTNNFISSLKGKMAPYAFNIGRTRITDEQSPVQFLLPNHPVFNYPNKITAKDFEGWVQERSVYHAEGLDANWQLPLGLNDPNEPLQNGSLAIAPYGKGNFVYTALVFFRELPAGVPGAYRLLANLLALPKH